MAGDWIAIATDLHRRREVLVVARETGRSPYEVVGYLAALWGWVTHESRNGHVPGVTCFDLSVTVGADVEFWRAISTVGWLEETPEGLTCPRWDTWNSVSAKTRLDATLRKRREREKTREEPEMSRNGHADVTKTCDMSRATETSVTVSRTPPSPPPERGGSAPPARRTRRPTKEERLEAEDDLRRDLARRARETVPAGTRVAVGPSTWLHNGGHAIDSIRGMVPWPSVPAAVSEAFLAAARKTVAGGASGG